MSSSSSSNTSSNTSSEISSNTYSHTSYGSEVEYSDFSSSEIDEDYDEDDEKVYSDFSNSSSSSEDEIEKPVFIILHIPLEKEVDGEVSKKKVSCCIKFNSKKQANRARSSLFQIEEIEYWIEDTYGNWYLSQNDDIIEIGDKNKKSKVDIDLTK